MQNTYFFCGKTLKNRARRRGRGKLPQKEPGFYLSKNSIG
jgi:hypothetical protein